MGRASTYLTVAQFDLLRWVADGCPEGVYMGGAHRVSARALHNRGLVRVSGQGSTWTASITPAGKSRLDEEAGRVEAERKRAQEEQRQRDEQARKRQEKQDRAVRLLEDVIAAGGRLALGTTISEFDVSQIARLLADQGLLPSGQRLAHEPTRMDPVLGVTAYLEPDIPATIPTMAVRVPGQLRSPHAAVEAFRARRQNVSKAQIPRAARILQGLVTAAQSRQWKVPAQRPSGSRRDASPDLLISTPSQEVVVTIYELDGRGRPGRAFVEDFGYGYGSREQRTVTNRHFGGSGRLMLTVHDRWGEKMITSVRESKNETLEEQLPAVLRTLDIAEAEDAWEREEETRRRAIREERWEEVKQEAFVQLAYQRNIEQLQQQLAHADDAARMRSYADSVEAHATTLGPSDEEAARGWAAWIRHHATSIDPLNGALRQLKVTEARHEDLQPFMHGWSAYGAYRQP